MKFMEKATELGYKAYSKEEIPVGAIIVQNDKIISACFNKREKSQIATHHAEILAIEKACKKLKSWRLDNCDIYVTLEPCPMCAGAIMNARIKNIFYAVEDIENGGQSRFKIFENTLNHNATAHHLKEYESINKNLIQNFFKSKRKNTKYNKKIEKI